MTLNDDAIRRIYLDHLSGKYLSEADREMIAEARKHPHFRAMFKTLNSVYANPNMRKLISVRPTSARMGVILLTKCCGKAAGWKYSRVGYGSALS